ncbi:DUF5050 domain-containing protein [Clostridium estertheticum]|uniref:DL-endopeptidase inhibitor IseA family protein n=1 Tax=Clostridium estertheticum TaxID=238834 RepID=UPI001C7D878B|nr:DL-endopeptidase inhibitor IseA family protein [Clostridium estertheticum]MBX4258451.1 DUF5050 domain-containing protein [Clostridium estertheticum]WLC69598.1 DUF5050 domain-containing protein [Clostridium estertheticum]
MKKNIKIIFSIVVVLVIGIGAYGKYADYKVNNDIKKIVSIQNQKSEAEVIRDYNLLLFKYKNNSKVYVALNNYYISKDKLDKAIDAIYKGLEQNKNTKLLTQVLLQDMQNARLQEGYLRVIKGSSIASSDKIPVKTKDGTTIFLELDIDTNKIDTSKEGFTGLMGKEKYTGTDVTVGVETLEFTGNTMGNNLMGGEMAFKDGWIYYRDPTLHSLCKMRKDLSGKIQLDPKVEPSSINIKDNNIYFIDSKSGKYGSLVKTDLNGKNKQVIRQNTSYDYIVGDNIYYTETTGEHTGWQIVRLNKMNFKFEDVEKNINTNMGYIKIINNKYNYSYNKHGGFIAAGKNKPTWGWGDITNYKSLTSAEVYKGEIYGNIGTASQEEIGFGKLDIKNNTQNVVIKNVENFNCIGNEIYYINEDGIFMASIDGTNNVKLMDIDAKPYETSLYNIADNMYVYSNEIKIVKKDKQETVVNTNVPDIKNQDIIKLCNDANKSISDIIAKRRLEQIQTGSTFYVGLDEPYSSKEKIKVALSKYFTKAYVEKFMGGQTFVIKDGKLYMIAGDSGVGAGYIYTSIQNRLNKGKVIQAVSNGIYYDDKSDTENGDIKLMIEDGKWKIDSFRSVIN